MKLVFTLADVDYNVQSISQFLDNSQTAYWTEPIFAFTPQIDRSKIYQLEKQDQELYLRTIFTQLVEENKNTLKAKRIAYQNHWEICLPQITKALNSAFKINLEEEFNDMNAKITFNPICPRSLSEHSFDLFYLNSDKGAVGIAIHEIIHFIWFKVWQEIFHDQAEEYETPHLKWILSEMVVDPIMRDPLLSLINPYFETGCVYDYFYTLFIDNKCILDHLYEMYQQMPIDKFMHASYKFCQNHEAEIRHHIETNE